MVPTIAIRAVTKTYASVPPVNALLGVTLQVAAGERVAITGHSGSGKSTLLNILGLLDEPTSGTYHLLGELTNVADARQRDRLRAGVLGFVFQDAHVLGHRTVTENIQLKLAVNQVARRNRDKVTENVLRHVGLAHRAQALGRLLSGGEKQRLAIARALVTEPQVLLADEPTGNLDEVNTRKVLDLFDKAARHGVAVVVITHDQRIAEWADRVLQLENGRLGRYFDGEVR
jgi:putative ABC transport system ATP-binding protein